ncbi:MAG: hypothetical protein E6K58_04060 [Nitrospirae bacterium]|nr:MAG: hypothetical protein E6K58_04060 [Nitrospirota bacterium]
MTPEEETTEMTIAIKQAVKVMGDRFALAEGDVARAIQELKASISAAHGHIDITETLVRLYVFLAQSLDRCWNEAARTTYPEHELQSHLSSTRAKMMEILSVNRVVKGKVEQECNRVRSLIAACLLDGAGKTAALDELKAERAVLKNKTMALSDLLAVFRAV